MTRFSGWSRYPVVDQPLHTASDPRDARAFSSGGTGRIVRGNGRSYGDAAIGASETLSMLKLDRMKNFDAASGLLTAEAGVLLADIIASFLPRGFYPRVVPGTRYVTLGGAIASDVHGKNHHRDGAFGNHVESLLIATPDGELLRASRSENAELFRATIGGQGLTGTIIEATVRLMPVETGWIRQRTIAASDLDEAMRALEENDGATYSVAWIDCLARGAHLGRSLVFLGEHARAEELEGSALNKRFPKIAPPLLGVPFDFPSLALNRLSVRLFNEFYYRWGARRVGSPFQVDIDPYFFPLDGISNWNRIYGRRGFVQHQCVIPADKAAGVLSDMLERITRRGSASFLAVLKKFGAASDGLLSFPQPGYTLALDFPMTPGLLEFLDELDACVVASGGRLYLAKDARQSRATFDAGYARAADTFRSLRQALDPAGRVKSRLAERLGL